MRRVHVLVAAALVAAVAGMPPGGADDDVDRPLAPAPGPRNEPSVAVSPRDPRVVLVVTHEFKTTLATGYGQQGLPDVVVYRSADAGRSFARVGAVPRPPGTRYTADPSVAFDDTGRAYVGYLASSDDTSGGLFVVRSNDGGRTWPRAATRVARASITPGGCVFHDKPYLAAGGGHVYVSWHTNAYDGPDCAVPAPYEVMVTRSVDAGRTFERPRVLAAGDDPTGATPAVARDGTVYVAYLRRGTACDGRDPVDVRVATSRDRGRTFVHRTAGSVCNAAPGAPNGGLYTMISHPTIAVEHRSGLVVVAAAQNAGTGHSVRVLASADRGSSWRATTLGAPTDVLSMPFAAAGAGRVAITYLQGGAGGTYDAFLRSSRGGHEWSAPKRLSSVPSAGNLRPFHADTWSIGHYLGLAVGSDGVAHAAWPDVRPGHPPSQVNVWTRSIRL